MKLHQHKKTSMLFGLLSLTFTMAISAQEDTTLPDESLDNSFAETNVLEEIIVTARKRQESLQDSPVAVSAMSADALQEAGITNIRDLQESVPGLNFSEQATKVPSIFIRGVGQKEANAALDPAVGVYINSIFIPRNDSQLLDTVDTESIQVLRGPQGTLFGKNNTGGAVLVTTMQPHNEGFEGYITSRVGDYGRRDLKLGANIPLNDESLAMRISAATINLDGYLDNLVDGSTFGDEDRQAASARLFWQASNSFSVDTFLYWSKQDENGGAFSCFFENIAADVAPLILPGGSNLYKACLESESVADDNKILINGPSKFQMQNQITALTLSWDINDDIELKSITSVSWQDDIFIEDDIDGTGISAVGNGAGAVKNMLERAGFDHEAEERKQFSQELQIIGAAFDETLSYTVGIFLAKEEMDAVPFSTLIGENSFTRTTALPGTVLAIHKFLGSQSDLVNKTAAIFGQATYDINDYFQLTLGARYTVENRERDTTYYFIDIEQFVQDLNDQGIQASMFDPTGIVTYPSVDDFETAAALYSDQGIPLTVVNDGDFNVYSVNAQGTPILNADGSRKYSEFTNLRKDETFKKFTPMMTGSFNVPEDLFEESWLDSTLIYLTYSRGFKAGGFEPNPSNLALIKYKPEEVENFEVGVKLDAWENRLRFNTALYRMNYDNIQIRTAEPGERGPADISLRIDNAGEATIQGIEMELTVLPMQNLKIMMTANYTDASYDEFEVISTKKLDAAGLIRVSSPVDRKNEPFASIPKKTFNVALMYDLMTSIGVFVPRVSMYYRDEVYTGVDFKAAEYAQTTIDGVALYTFRLTYIPFDDGSLNFSISIDNLTDKDYYQGGLTVADAQGTANLTKGSPRAFSLEATYSF